MIVRAACFFIAAFHLVAVSPEHAEDALRDVKAIITIHDSGFDHIEPEVFQRLLEARDELEKQILTKKNVEYLSFLNAIHKPDVSALVMTFIYLSDDPLLLDLASQKHPLLEGDKAYRMIGYEHYQGYRTVSFSVERMPDTNVVLIREILDHVHGEVVRGPPITLRVEDAKHLAVRLRAGDLRTEYLDIGLPDER